VTPFADSSGRKIPVCLLIAVVAPDVTCLYARADESLMRTSWRDRPDEEQKLRVLPFDEAYLALAIVSVSGCVICWWRL